MSLNAAQILYNNYSAAVKNTFNSEYYNQTLQEGKTPSDLPKTLETLKASTLDQLKSHNERRKSLDKVKNIETDAICNDSNSTDSLVTKLVASESTKLGIKKHKKHKCHHHGHKHKHHCKKHHKKGTPA